MKIKDQVLVKALRASAPEPPGGTLIHIKRGERITEISPGEPAAVGQTLQIC